MPHHRVYCNHACKTQESPCTVNKYKKKSHHHSITWEEIEQCWTRTSNTRVRRWSISWPTVHINWKIRSAVTPLEIHFYIFCRPSWRGEGKNRGKKNKKIHFDARRQSESGQQNAPDTMSLPCYQITGAAWKKMKKTTEVYLGEQKNEAVNGFCPSDSDGRRGRKK